VSIEVERITRCFGAFTALDDVSLQVPSGALVALLGPSGCGKTTLLRIIAGLDVPDAGRILFHGRDTTERQVGERRVGFVFQHYALFRHLTVFENVAFGLRVRPRRLRPTKAQIQARVTQLLEMVQMGMLAQRYPDQLSGGQRQRCALARALAVEPQVLLLDEPFGALDAKVRRELRRWLRRLHDELLVTSVFVTHDQEEALEVADRVVVMNAGRVEQVGTPSEVYDHPANPFVYHFLGNVNLFHGRVCAGRARIGDIDLEVPEHAAVPDSPVVAYARPHDLDLQRHGVGAALAGVVRHIAILGPVVRLELELADGRNPIEVELSRERYAELGLQEGEKVYVTPRRLRVFCVEEGEVSLPPDCE
jgi:sulfate transport system ATP-binding protein